MKSAASEIEEITRRRREQARELGFEATEVEIIAADWDIELDDLKRLIDQGCRPMTALRILR